MLTALRSHAETFGEKVFLKRLGDSAQLSFFELNVQVVSLSTKLISELSVQFEDRVLVLYSNPLEHILGILACAQAGAIAGTLPFTYPYHPQHLYRKLIISSTSTSDNRC